MKYIKGHDRRQITLLKEEVKDVEQIRRGIYNVLREENGREHPIHQHDLDR